MTHGRWLRQSAPRRRIFAKKRKVVGRPPVLDNQAQRSATQRQRNAEVAMSSSVGPMERAAFVSRFGGVFEHSPWIAEAVYEASAGRPPLSADALHAAMCAVFRGAGRARQLDVVRAHPDLAGRLALAGGLTAESTAEQRSAGLDQCSPAELRRFTELNDAYQARFGFPFIMAVKGRPRAEILAAFERRLANDAETELATALDEIERIAALRLAELCR